VRSGLARFLRSAFLPYEVRANWPLGPGGPPAPPGGPSRFPRTLGHFYRTRYVRTGPWVLAGRRLRRAVHRDSCLRDSMKPESLTRFRTRAHDGRTDGHFYRTRYVRTGPWVLAGRRLRRAVHRDSRCA